MCDKCKENKDYEKKYSNTRYCDDWWDDTPHEGSNGDRDFQAQWERQEQENNDTPSIAE